MPEITLFHWPTSWTVPTWETLLTCIKSITHPQSRVLQPQHTFSTSNWTHQWRWPMQKPRWFGLLLINGTFSTDRLYHAIELQCISRRAGEQHNHTIEQWNNRINQKNHTHRSVQAFWRRSLTMVRPPQRSLSGQSFGKYWNLTQTTKRPNTYQQKLTIHKKGC